MISKIEELKILIQIYPLISARKDTWAGTGTNNII
jgi:hypothetical protein